MAQIGQLDAMPREFWGRAATHVQWMDSCQTWAASALEKAIYYRNQFGR